MIFLQNLLFNTPNEHFIYKKGLKISYALKIPGFNNAIEIKSNIEKKSFFACLFFKNPKGEEQKIRLMFPKCQVLVRY